MIDGARILVVEDDAAINKVVCSYLGKLGAECVPAFSGTEGLMHLEGERRFDLLITDLMLPGAPGEEVVAAARARHVPSSCCRLEPPWPTGSIFCALVPTTTW